MCAPVNSKIDKQCTTMCFLLVSVSYVSNGWPEALNQIRISDLVFLIYLGNPLLSSDLGYSAQMGHPDGYVADSRSI
jgi:hypothetical protein